MILFNYFLYVHCFAAFSSPFLSFLLKVLFYILGCGIKYYSTNQRMRLMFLCFALPTYIHLWKKERSLQGLPAFFENTRVRPGKNFKQMLYGSREKKKKTFPLAPFCEIKHLKTSHPPLLFLFSTPFPACCTSSTSF